MYQSVFPQRQDKDLTHGLYTQSAAAAAAAAAVQTNIYGNAMPNISSLSGGGMQGLSLHLGNSRAISNSSQYNISRASTAPAGYNALSGTGVTGITQLGAPSPPLSRAGVLPLGSSRTGLVTATQGIGSTKQTAQSRPSTLSSAIGSIPLSAYGGLSRAAQGMSPISNMATYGGSFPETSSQGFDPSDFPLLSLARSRQECSGGLVTNSSALPSRSMYGQLSKPSETVPGFQMHSEDFPALPGSAAKTSESSEFPQDSSKYNGSSFTVERTLSLNSDQGMANSSSVMPEFRSYDPAPGSNKERLASSTVIGPPKLTVKKSQTATVSIPPGMVQDQFGMMGLLTFIRGAETDPNLVSLALGSDLTTLGLNLNSPESLYNTFASPWADAPCRPQDIDNSVPQEYLIHPYIREKLAPIKLSRYSEDLLFYLYYSYGGDLLQLLAATELYARDWRYHKDERIWITRAQGMKPTKQEATFEEGTYCFFDVGTWRKAHKEFHVEYDKLEERPSMPSNLLGHQGLTSVPTQA
ncbi:hypothetical protein EMCRGX_G020572 [Ephydatia muelleri]|eukprot:Em0016g542a